MERLESYTQCSRLGSTNPSTLTRLGGLGSYIGVYMEMVDYDDEDDYMRIVYALDETRTNRQGRMPVVMEVELYRSPEVWDLWEITSCALARKHQGFGFAPALYRLIMQKGNIRFKAGESQSLGGRYIWVALAKDPAITVVARKNSRAPFVEVEVDEEFNEITTRDYDCYHDEVMDDDEARQNLNKVEVFAYASV